MALCCSPAGPWQHLASHPTAGALVGPLGLLHPPASWMGHSAVDFTSASHRMCFILLCCLQNFFVLMDLEASKIQAGSKERGMMLLHCQQCDGLSITVISFNPLFCLSPPLPPPLFLAHPFCTLGRDFLMFLLASSFGFCITGFLLRRASSKKYNLDKSSIKTCK